jgi:uncharacterized protein YdbL (DUF1318 family)
MRIVLAIALLLALWMPSRAADAPDLDQLRKTGVVGERYDGLAVIRGDKPDASLKAVVDEINAKRSEIYRERAKAQGVSAIEVGKVYALEIVEKAPKGMWFLGEDRKWVQKK